MKGGPQVTEFLETRAFKRAFKKLPAEIVDEYKGLVKEMIAGRYTPGRDLKPRQGTKKNQPKVWQARLNLDYRVTFTFKKGLATMLAIGPHKLFD